MMTQAQAKDIVARQASTDTYPTLTSADLDNILARHLRFGTRADSTAYSIGDTVVLSSTNYNARVYRCRTAGTSAADETGVGFPTNLSAATGQLVQDGSAVWQDDGPAGETYDTGAATKDAWLQKAAIAAQDHDHNDGATDMRASQVHAHCLAMAARYEPMWVA